MSGPFEQHLLDAIELNRARAPLYAALSGGASRRISTALITAERLLLVVARRFDRAAAPWHCAGIPLLEALFAPMARTPPFDAHRPWRSTTGSNIAVDVRAIRSRVRRSFGERQFAGAAAALGEALALLAAEPQANSLVRHLLESAHRLAVLAPEHVALSREKGLPTPAPLLGRLLRLHLWGLVPARALDQRALPLQMRGIAILTQDVPTIGLTPERMG